MQEGVASNTGNAATTKSNVFSSTNADSEAYKYVRFVCTNAQTTIDANNAEYAFGLSEFSVRVELSDADEEILKCAMQHRL